jgi:hypothetical protein
MKNDLDLGGKKNVPYVGSMDELKDKAYVLNKITHAMEIRINPQDFAQLSFAIGDRHFGQYAIYIEREMFGERVQKEVDVDVSFSYPKTWWQHFKKENFPNWLLKKYPVQYAYETKTETVLFDRNFVFPNAYKQGHDVLGRFIIRDFHEVRASCTWKNT